MGNMTFIMANKTTHFLLFEFCGFISFFLLVKVGAVVLSPTNLLSMHKSITTVGY